MNAASYQSKLQIPSNNRAGEREGDVNTARLEGEISLRPSVGTH